MSYADFIQKIEAEWDPDDGFFWKARKGQFDQHAFTRTLEKLRSLTIDDDAELPRRLVSVLWYIPLFMSWQIERVREVGGDENAYSLATTATTNEIERLLGVPKMAMRLDSRRRPNSPDAGRWKDGRQVGTGGQTCVQIVVRDGTTQFITAFPK